MKLLIITQVVDSEHPVLGFFHRWLLEFSKHVEELHVIALQVGTHDLPENVHIHSLGKEEGVGKLVYLYRFYKYIFSLKYDHVFVHMNQIYVLLGWKWWKLLGKKVGLWYVHRKVSLSLHFATVFTDHVFTTSSESFRINTKKRTCLGHGIDMKQFAVIERTYVDELRIMTSGRVTETKRISEIIDAVKELHKNGENVSLSIVGGPVTKEDVAYEKRLREGAPDFISFVGNVPHRELPSILAKHDVFVNLSNTGSKDKAVLEALATGMPVVSSNVAFKGVLPSSLFIKKGDSVARALLDVSKINVTDVTDSVRKENALPNLIKNIVATYEKS